MFLYLRLELPKTFFKVKLNSSDFGWHDLKKEHEIKALWGSLWVDVRDVNCVLLRGVWATNQIKWILLFHSEVWPGSGEQSLPTFHCGTSVHALAMELPWWLMRSDVFLAPAFGTGCPPCQRSPGNLQTLLRSAPGSSSQGLRDSTESLFP